MMRLVCPNCEAKYEVPEDAIPETGRDVQCANCGHSWYQMRPRSAVSEAPPAPVAAAPVAAAAAPVAAPVAAAVPEPEPEPEVVAEAPVAAGPAPVDEGAAGEPDRAEDAAEAVPAVEALPVEPVPEVAATEPVGMTDAPVAEPDVSPEAGAAIEAEDTAAADPVGDGGPDPETMDDEVPAEPPAAAVAAGAGAYAVDDSVLAILREEAEREAQARKAEAAKPLETQTELGIEEAMPEVSLPRQPIVEEATLAARRSRLPDVEEINSTLRPVERAAEDDAADPGPVAAEGRSSFRSGFLMVMTVAILGSAVYGSADAIAEAVPSLAGMLKGYVGFVDSLRLQLDGLMQSATVAINGT